MTGETTILVADPSRARREGEAPAALPAKSDASQIMGVISRAASDPNFDPEKMLKLLEFRDKEIARIAEMEFIQAMADFKKNPPKILKDKLVRIPHKQGPGVTEYKHATLGGIVAAVIDGLSQVGISHRWDIEQLEGGMIRVTCVLTHRGGHSTRTPFTNSQDDSGSKNNLQAKMSTITYAQRYTLMSALGLAAEDDNDGAGDPDDYERITEGQVADLEALISEHGGNKVKLLAYLRLDSLGDIRAENFKSTCDLVRDLATQKGQRGRK